MAYRPLNFNTRTKIPKNFLFVDTETTLHKVSDRDTRHDFRLGVFTAVTFAPDGSRKWEATQGFTSAREFWEAITGWAMAASPLYIVAHNAIYDMTVLNFRDYLVEMGFDCNSHFTSGMTLVQKWVKGKNKIIILDNSNWFPGPLEDWGKEIGTPKLPMPPKDASDMEWFTYCKRDVEIMVVLQEALLTLTVKEDLGHWGKTLASCSLKAYRHKFMKRCLSLPSGPSENEFAKQAYFGGRTECLYQGKQSRGPYFKLDVNSMYPYVMRNKEFPIELSGHRDSASVRELAHLLKDYAVIARVDIAPSKPYFVHAEGKKRLYPVGPFTAFLSTPELKLALENGWVKKVYELSWYRQRVIFRDYVDYFYTKRQEYKRQGKQLWATLFKGYLNRLYGKFAQRGFKEKIMGKANKYSHSHVLGIDAETGTLWEEIQVGENILRISQEGFAQHAFVAIAAHVTAYARLHLYSLVEAAGRRNCFYMDTDSLIVNRKGFDRLWDFIDQDELGALKIQGVEDEIEIVAPKEYRFGEKWVIKGIKKNAVRTNPRTFKQEMWPGIATIIARKLSDYHTYTYERTNRAKVDTGRVTWTGHVLPYVLPRTPHSREMSWERFHAIVKGLIADAVSLGQISLDRIQEGMA
jgi:hypothetical protein